MAEGRGRPGGGSPVAGRRLLLLLLLPGALLSFLPQATPHPSVTHRYENVKAVEISVQPTAVEEVISGGKDAVEVQQPSNTGEIAAKQEEETLNDLVNLLQDVVKNIPTELVMSTEHPPNFGTPEIVTSPSVAVDTVWVNVNPQNSEKSRTIALMKKDTPTTTAFWKLRNDVSASVILHSDASPSEDLPSETSESVILLSEEPSPGNTLSTISVQLEKEATTKKEAPPITEMKLDIELPPSLSSEASAAEIKLDVEVTPSPSTVPPVTRVEIDISPSPSTSPSASEVDIILPPSESLEKKAEDTEKEMGKLKAFINLLYGFSPELTEYAENSPHKKMAQDIVERSMEVLDAIKSVFCGNPKKQSKQVLKHLLQKDMELVRQAMKEKKAS
ncbi:mucin-2-like isoform X3 [Ahaetulla prasina]|uniref:mucin-2-like isoform X3 n=1 Tax=Ahaetulla prasina TaxID=499056 RepID=UPI00264869E5|nr:mucin-2-like isoform X3 [Ahaetulla prasina]